MPDTAINYRRLPGTNAGIARRSTLWLGEDHLLAIHSSGYTEDYKRFYFRDIQAIVIRKTESGRIMNIVFGALAVPPLIAALVTSGGWSIGWSIVTALALLFLVINTLYGPTCTTHLRTAVQTEALLSLKRLRRARKVLARLRPLIVEAQGELAPSEIPARMAELAHPPVVTTAAEVSPITETVIQPPAAETPPLV